MQRSKRWSFDQLVGATQQQQRHSDAEQDQQSHFSDRLMVFRS